MRSHAPTGKILENTKQIARSSLSLWKNKTYSSKGSGATVGYSKIGYPIFIAKSPHQDKYYGSRPITAAPGLIPLKTKAKGQAPEPPALLRFVRPSPSHSIPVTSSRHPSIVTSSRRSTPSHNYCFARPPYCNALPQARTAPYLFLLRNRSSSRHAGLPRNL
jgi:hypothetical protein